MASTSTPDVASILKEIRQLGKFRDSKDYEISYVLPMVNVSLQFLVDFMESSSFRRFTASVIFGILSLDYGKLR